MNSYLIPYLSILFLFLCACEDKIVLELEPPEDKLVITGDLLVGDNLHTISIQQVISIDNGTMQPVKDAQVSVKSLQSGRLYDFLDQGDGNYSNTTLRLRENVTYELSVITKEGDLYHATSTAPVFIPVDSIGFMQRIILKDTLYYPTFVFTDPVDQTNFYKYKMSVNGQPFRFVSALNDKYNNGLEVQHDIYDDGNELKQGDVIRVLRQCIDKSSYDYWRTYQEINPSSVSPSNPISNLSNGALGYFGVSTGKYYDVEFAVTGRISNDVAR